MHTLTVELVATYLVGVGQWVVHNVSCDPTLGQVRALREFGLGDVERRVFYDGDLIVVRQPLEIYDGNLTKFIELDYNNDLLNGYIYDIDISDLAQVKAAGAPLFSQFREQIRNIAREFDVASYMLGGVRVQNNKLSDMLLRLKFTPSNYTLPPEIVSRERTVIMLSRIFKR